MFKDREMNKQHFYTACIAVVFSVLSFFCLQSFSEGKNGVVQIEHIKQTPAVKTVYGIDDNGKTYPLDFNHTASKVLDGVVHITATQVLENTMSPQVQRMPDPFQDFFGDRFDRFFFSPSPDATNPKRPKSRVGTGSGVVVSPNGYIITNNHVIENSDDIEVTLHDNRNFKATIVGTDPTTDLALLQIKATDLTVVPFEDSDKVKIGQWVLALGNPMGLNSTVTAGIVSAKGRNINILKEKYAVENFIQTDAAINPGNSGGALVNLNGGLIGINTAIASPTGSFAGYGFAIPVNIVKKVMEDLIQYGMVQRGVLGIMIRSVDGALAKQKELNVKRGIYVDSIMDGSAAAEAGISIGDVILEVNGTVVNSSPELQGEIAQHRPGDEVVLKIDRKGKRKEYKVKLNNPFGQSKTLGSSESGLLKILGVVVEDIPKEKLKELDIKSGVKVNKIMPGKLRRETKIKDGFIITHLNQERIRNTDQLLSMLESNSGGFMIEGFYEDIPGDHYYAFGLDEKP